MLRNTIAAFLTIAALPALAAPGKRSREYDNGRKMAKNLAKFGESGPAFSVKSARASSLAEPGLMAASAGKQVEFREVDEAVNRSFDPRAVTQNGIAGDCFVLSAAVALKAAGLFDARNVFTKNKPRRSYHVRLHQPDGVPEHVEITRTLPIDLDSSRPLYASSMDRNPFIAFHEKAYALGSSRDPNTGFFNGTYDHIGSGGWPGVAMSRVSGYHHVSMPVSGPGADPNYLLKIFRRAKKNGLAVTLSTLSAPKNEGIIADHAYAKIVDVEKDKSGEWVLTLKNPWGFVIPGDNGKTESVTKKDIRSKGVFTIRLADLPDNFSMISLAGPSIKETRDLTGLEHSAQGIAEFNRSPRTWQGSTETAELDALVAKL